MKEEEIIQGCKRGSGPHQQLLYDRYASRMYAVCIRYARTKADAADILQEGFIKIFTKINQYQGQGVLEGWIRKVMVNTALRHYQRQRYDLESVGHEQLPDTIIESDALSSLSEQELLALISRLPEGYRLVFNLVAIEGYSHAEAAEMLNIQESTSRSQLTKARRWLADQLASLQRIA